MSVFAYVLHQRKLINHGNSMSSHYRISPSEKGLALFGKNREGGNPKISYLWNGGKSGSNQGFVSSILLLPLKAMNRVVGKPERLLDMEMQMAGGSHELLSSALMHLHSDLSSLWAIWVL